MITDNIWTPNASPFVTTQWTMVLEAARWQTPSGREAFEYLYLVYWRPLYGFVRRKGFTPVQAEDVIQDFFARLLEKQSLTSLAREGGKFRSFLLAAMGHFLANEWDRARTQKRGGGRRLLSLNDQDAEEFLTIEPAVHENPATLFEREWALSLLEEVMRKLDTECRCTGKSEFLEDIRLHLQRDPEATPYALVAAKHGMTEGAAKVAVHRLRLRYGEILRQEIARTVQNPEEVDAELRYLIEVVSF